MDSPGDGRTLPSDTGFQTDVRRFDIAADEDMYMPTLLSANGGRRF